jgi:putative ABC transport system permease protein
VNRVVAYVAEAFEAIWRNRTRSLLTMLGMIIGTSSIIGVLGISKAASGGIKSTLASFGSAGIIVAVDGNQDDPASAQIYYRDLPLLSEMTASTVSRYFPNFNATYKLRANGISYDTTVQAQEDNTGDTLTLKEGRRIDTNDIANATHVTLLSLSIAERFFGNQPAVGQTLRIGGSRFTVIGVYDPLKAALLGSIAGNDYIEIPYSTFHQLKPGPIDYLQAFAKPGVSTGDAIAAIQTALHRLHGERSRYIAQDADAQIQAINNVLGLVATGLTAIGGVALVVAGIGIMNIMLVSVAERTREIGLRKSIGASRSDILTQFLFEAILLSAMGGGIGTLLGLGATLGFYGVVSSFVGPAPIPYLLIVSVAVGFSTLVGTVFGTYPAYRASRLDPIAALRS